MRKNYRPVNKIDFNRKRYNAIMESIIPEVKKIIKEEEETLDDEDIEDKELDDDLDLDERVLNELFGFGSSAKKPEKALSLENTDEENAELFIQWCGYFMSSAGNNVKKGLDAFIKASGDVLVKIPKLIVKGILMLLSGTIKGAVFGIGTIASIILGSISFLIRCVNSGIVLAKESLSTLYQNISKGLNAFYNWFSEKATNVVTSAKEKVELWLGAIAGALMAVANKMTGAAEALGDFFKKVLNDAKDKKDGAVFMVKTWLSTKSAEVKEWIGNTVQDLRSTVVKAWNAMDKKVRKAYDNIASKLEDWIQDIKELVSAAAEKIGDAVNATKEFAIDKKDKALIWGIQKGVKGLSKNYTEDQVVALVRKCYNENLVPDIRGNYHINEAYFYKKGTKMRSLYENKKIRKIKNLRLLK